MIEKIETVGKLIAIYARVSTSTQENEGTIETQLSKVHEFAKENDYIIVQEYHDNGWSGDTLVRPELDKLRVDAKNKKWEAVLVYDPDRLARRYSYQELLVDELREAGIEVIFMTTRAPNDPIEKILFGVQGLFSEYERAKIAERFRIGKMRKAKENHVLASEAPYGYTLILKTDERQGYYVVDDYESSIVKSIFSWVADEGLTLRAVVRRLQELSILPRKSKRGVWSTSTLSTLLRNKTYIGEAHYGASYAVVAENPFKKEIYRKTKKTSRKMRPEEEWIKITTPKIIDEDLFIRAGERLKANFAMCERNKKNEYLLSGKVYCSCGQRRCGEGPQRGKHLYYRCSSRVKSFPLPSTCYEKGVNARIVDKVLWARVSQLMKSPELMMKQVERWMNNQRTKPSVEVIDLDATKKELSKLKEQEDRYNKGYGAGVFTLDQLKEYTVPVREKIASLESQISKVGHNINQNKMTSTPSLDQIEVYAQKAKEKLSNLNFEAKRGIITSILEKVVATQEYIHVNGYIPLKESTLCRETHCQLES